MELNHHDSSGTTSDSDGQPHDPVVADVIEAFDRGADTVSEMTLCHATGFSFDATDG